MTCLVEDVYAPDGSPSRLFQQLVQVTTSDQNALELYLNVMGEPLSPQIIGENGEPDLEDVIHRSDLGFNNVHRAIFSTQDYSIAVQRSTATESLKKQFKVARQNILRTMSKNMDPGLRARLQERLDILEEQLASLTSTSGATKIRAMADEHIQWAKSLADSSRALSYEELLLGIQTINAWDFEVTQNFLSHQQIKGEVQMVDILKEISNEATAVGSRLRAEAWEKTLENVNTNLPVSEPVTMEDIKTMNPSVDNYLMTRFNFLDLSREDQRLIQRFDQLLKLSKRNQAAHINDITNEVQERLNQVDDHDVLLQKDEDGDITGNLIGPHSNEFIEERRKAMNQFSASQDAALNRGMKVGKKYRKQFTKKLQELGEVIDVRYFIDDLDNPKNYDSPEAYRQYLISKLGKEEAERAISAAIEEYRRWEDHREGQKDMVESEIANGLHKKGSFTPQEYRKKRMEELDNRTSPLQLIREIHDGASPLVFNDGWEYAYVGARPELQDDAWSNLTDTEKEVAQYLSTLYGNLMRMLPDHISREFDDNFLPRIQKDLVERMMEDGWEAALSQWDEEMYHKTTGGDIGRLQNPDNNVTNPFDGMSDYNKIPIEGIRTKDQSDSTDILRITTMFAANVFNYAFMSEVEAEAQLMATLMEDASEGVEGGRYTMDAIKHNLDAMLYGHARAKEEGIEGSVAVANPANPANWKKNREAKKKKRQIEQEYAQLEEDYANGEITQSEYEKQVKILEGQYDELNGRKIAPMKLIESTLGRFTMLKSLGWNIRAGAANLLFGLMSANVHAAGGQDFTSRDFRNAFLTFLNLKMSGSGKVGNLVREMNILHQISEIAYGEGPRNADARQSFVKRVTKSPYGFMQSTETMAQAITMMAHMMHETVEVEVNGETQEISLWEGFGEDGKWKADEYGERPEYDPKVSATGQNEFTKLRDRVIQINKRLHGNYDVNSNLLIKRLALGRLLTMFRTWIFEGVSYRFENKKWDAQLGRHVKGSYRSPFDVAMHKGVGGLGQLFKAALTKDFDGENADVNLEEIDIRNMRKVMQDMKWFAGLMAVMIALKMTIDDDDTSEPHEWAARNTINTLIRIQQDITFYLSPVTVVNIVNNPMPVMTTANEFIRAINSTKRFLTESDYQGNPAYAWARSLPLTRVATKMWWMSNNLLVSETGTFI